MMGSSISPDTFQSLVALVAGILILAVPRLLNYVVAAYLIIAGALGLWSSYRFQNISPQAVVSLAGGVLILIKPRLLNYIVAICLIAIGVLGLLPM